MAAGVERAGVPIGSGNLQAEAGADQNRVGPGRSGSVAYAAVVVAAPTVGVTSETQSTHIATAVACARKAEHRHRNAVTHRTQLGGDERGAVMTGLDPDRIVGDVPDLCDHRVGDANGGKLRYRIVILVPRARGHPRAVADAPKARKRTPRNLHAHRRSWNGIRSDEHRRQATHKDGGRLDTRDRPQRPTGAGLAL